jgi:hypothetical protein
MVASERRALIMLRITTTKMQMLMRRATATGPRNAHSVYSPLLSQQTSWLPYLPRSVIAREEAEEKRGGGQACVTSTAVSNRQTPTRRGTPYPARWRTAAVIATITAGTLYAKTIN